MFYNSQKPISYHDFSIFTCILDITLVVFVYRHIFDHFPWFRSKLLSSVHIWKRTVFMGGMAVLKIRIFFTNMGFNHLCTLIVCHWAYIHSSENFPRWGGQSIIYVTWWWELFRVQRHRVLIWVLQNSSSPSWSSTLFVLWYNKYLYQTF